MDVTDIIEIWAEDNGLDILWGHDPDDSPYQYFFEVHGARGDEQSMVDDLDFVLNKVGYQVDMAYDYKGGVRIEVSRY